jgi:C-terminal processing protease CtpA/Prc
MEDYAGVEYYSYSINGKNATLTIRLFFEGNKKFDSFLEEFFQKAKDEDIENLTIDVRGNFGGSPQMSKELLSYLVCKETTYFTENTKLPLLYKLQGLNEKILPKENNFAGSKTLIIDAGCFSTCGHFAAIFKTNDLGNVIGEPTGGGAVCTDGAKDIILRNTGIRLHCSQTLYEVAANESMRNTVRPD